MSLLHKNTTDKHSKLRVPRTVDDALGLSAVAKQCVALCMGSALLRTPSGTSNEDNINSWAEHDA